MKYFYENDIVKQGWASYDQLNNASTKPINVRFCRNCPKFVPNGVQFDYPIIKGYCNRLSYDEPEEGEYPYYVHVTADDFCNEDSIEDEVL